MSTEPDAGPRPADLRLRLIASAAAGLLAARTATDAVTCVFDRLAGAVPVDTCVHYRLEDDRGSLRLEWHAGLPAPVPATLAEVSLGEQIDGAAAAARRPRVVEHVQASVDPRTDRIRRAGLTAYACYPLLGRQRVIGTIAFGSRTEGTFAPDALDAMAALVELAALTLERVAAAPVRGPANAELLASRELLTNIIDSSPSSIFARDLEGRLILVNETIARTYGTSKEAALGMSYDDIYEADVAEVIRAGEQQVLTGGVPHTFEERLPRDGVTRTFITTKFPLRDGEGRIYGIGGVITDVTAWKDAEQALVDSEERFRTLADNIAQLAWMADGTGAATWYNKRWFDYTGTTLAEAEGWGWRQRHHPEHLERVVERMRRCFETGESWEDTYPLRGRDGTYRWFLSRAIPIRDAQGRASRWFGTSTDITELRQAEEALRATDRLKDEFLAMLAHELRNPLAPIRFAVSLLGQAGVDEATKVRTCAIIDRQVTHLTRLVDDLLDVSRITRNRIELRRERLDVRGVVRAALEAAAPQIGAAHHQLSTRESDGPIWVDADQTRLTQAFSNLLNNAVKFTPPGGSIRVTASTEGHDAVVAVHDSGIGMPASVTPHVFDMFYQGRPTMDGTAGGLGIGLTLVKRLVEMHGGTVRAFSAGPGQGSSFSVRLPVLRTGEAAPREARSQHDLRPSAALRVLVVDDNVDSADMLELLVRSMGHETRKVTDPHDALAAIESFRPQVALLDIGMPGMSGYELARQVRDRGGRVPMLVAITGWGQDEDRRRALEAGFDRHLTKPADPEVIRRLLLAAAEKLA